MTDRKGVVSFAFKADQEGAFRATIATFNVIDRDGDVTMPGAFTPGQKVRIAQWGHNWGAPAIGDGALGADETKAWVDGQFYLDTAAGLDTYKAVKRLSAADLQEWSYGYEVKEFSFGEFEGQPVRFLRELSVIEASPVMLGAGVGTGTDTIKDGRTLADESATVLAAVAGLAGRLRSHAELRTAKEGRTLSAANRARLGEHRDALRSIAGDLHDLLLATAPDDGKAADRAAIDALYGEFARIESRLVGALKGS